MLRTYPVSYTHLDVYKRQALYQKQNYSYAGIIEALSGAPFDVRFISFDDILANPEIDVYKRQAHVLQAR